jgi:hypothetical protein
MRAILLSAVVSVAAGWACASSIPPPNDAWAAAQADVGRAQAGGAANVPDAKLHLELAQEDLAKSKPLIGDDNRRATSLIEAGRAEAQLALSLAKQAEAEATAHKAKADLDQGAK